MLIPADFLDFSVFSEHDSNSMTPVWKEEAHAPAQNAQGAQ
jgi:hypothetical protein